MASFTAFAFTIFLTFDLAIAQSYNVTPGSLLTPTGATTSWLSPSGLYAFGFYPQTHGYALGIYIAGIPERTVVWTASRDTLPVSKNATLYFTTDGRRLTLDQGQGQKINIFDQTDADGASFASMQDSGNFVLLDSDGMTVLWQTFDHPTETLLAGQQLVPKQALFSSVSETDQSLGIFKLKMQPDGNLVQYPSRGIPDTIGNSYWFTATFTAGPNVKLNLDSGGFLYLVQNSTNFIRNITEGGYPTKDAIYRMKIDVDGILRLYYHDLSNKSKNGSIIWESSTDKCVARGLCGINGYCLVMNDTARCQCLPGFEFVNTELWSLGCERNYTLESCKIQDAGTTFQMTSLINARWEDTAYEIAEASTSQEKCSKACLDDCNCEAALFTGQECRFQKLPLRFVAVNQSLPYVGLIKVYSSSVKNGSNPFHPSIHIKKSRKMKILLTSVSLISFAIIIMLFSGVLIFCRRHIQANRNKYENANVKLSEEMGPREFSYAELERITNGFQEELGRGSFGIVYKGMIENSKKAVAVKKLREELTHEGEQEFQTEMKVIGRTHHRNLATLVGYCSQGSERLLVFEYMTKGSLADILFTPKESKPKPCWTERIRMAIDIARGIVYLHEECEKTIIHCDIKPHNILMDEYGCAKISDFGLAKLLENDQTRTNTLIRGTRGYVAPEWHKKLPITVKVDVYSFGILFFNILCCRRNVDNSLPVDEAVLAEWVYDCYEAGQVSKLVNGEDVDNWTLVRMVQVGLWCIQEDPSIRPSMKKVLLMLEGSIEIPVPPNPASILSVF
ncbi:bulb-type lectin domain-containing protein [Artemisia annua]|uniref:Receptor-like serine/threonine-protein kinase n=1 Tax=Artemisia annua TaxID=35608 RepID=A0A2U1LXY2_ARTAN|nr:bulb-type lectin domain-containing protein [Artemisia annua]